MLGAGLLCYDHQAERQRLSGDSGAVCGVPFLHVQKPDRNQTVRGGAGKLFHGGAAGWSDRPGHAGAGSGNSGNLQRFGEF